MTVQLAHAVGPLAEAQADAKRSPGRLALHYDGALAEPLRALTPDAAQAAEAGKRLAAAAKAAGVGLIAYTSAPYADTTPMLLTGEHRATEEMIRASGLPFVLLRNEGNALPLAADALGSVAVVGQLAAHPEWQDKARAESMAVDGPLTLDVLDGLGGEVQ